MPLCVRGEGGEWRARVRSGEGPSAGAFGSNSLRREFGRESECPVTNSGGWAGAASWCNGDCTWDGVTSCFLYEDIIAAIAAAPPSPNPPSPPSPPPSPPALCCWCIHAHERGPVVERCQHHHCLAAGLQLASVQSASENAPCWSPLRPATGCGLAAPTPPPRARGSGDRPARCCRTPTGTGESRITTRTTRTAFRFTRVASGTTPTALIAVQVGLPDPAAAAVIAEPATLAAGPAAAVQPI